MAQALTDRFLRDYIAKRETINHVDEAERYQWVRAFTDPDWFRFWQSQIAPTSEKSPLVRFRKEGMTREVIVTSLLPLPGVKHGYRAEFTTIDRRAGQEVQRGAWIAQFLAYRQSIAGNPEIAEYNPLGITVANYAISASSDVPERPSVQPAALADR